MFNIYIYIYIYTHMCIHIYIYIYTHIHIIHMHVFQLARFQLNSRVSTIAYVLSKMPFESSNVPGDGPIFPDVFVEH